jgi:hypothetical protein
MRDKVDLPGRIVFSCLIFLLSTFGVKCISHPISGQIATSEILSTCTIMTLVLYWLLWFVLSVGKFKHFKCFCLLLAAAVLAMSGQAYSSSLCGR